MFESIIVGSEGDPVSIHTPALNGVPFESFLTSDTLQTFSNITLRKAVTKKVDVTGLVNGHKLKDLRKMMKVCELLNFFIENYI